MFYQRSLLYRFLDSFFRHKWIFIITTVTVSVIVLAALLSKPKTYIGGYTVIQDSRMLENPLAPGQSSSSDGIDQSVNHLQNYISTSSFLKNVLTAPDGTEIPLDIPINLSDDNQLANLRKAITVDQSANDAFTVGMEYKDANDITTIVNAIITTYINEVAQEKSAFFTNSVTFIQQQVDYYRAKLMASEAALTNFKAANASNLPAEQAAIEGELVSLQSQAQDLQIQADEDKNREQYLQSQLSQIPATVIASSTATDSPIITQLKALQSQLVTDTVVYQMKPNHPQVVALQASIERLKQKIAQMNARGDNEAKGLVSTETSPNPLYQSLQGEVVQIEIDEKGIEAKRAETLQLLSNDVVANSKVPAAQRTLSNLERDYGTDSATYNNLMDRLAEAQMSEQLNLRQATSAYTWLLTSPPLSSQGASKVAIMFVGGVFVAMVLGVGLVILSEWMDPSLRDPTDAQRALELPLLAVLPESSALMRGEHLDNLLTGSNTAITVTKAVSG